MRSAVPVNVHARRAWPVKGKEVAERRVSLINNIRRDLNLFEERFVSGDYWEVRKVLTEILQFVRSNNRHMVQCKTVQVAEELVKVWLEKKASARKAVSDWAGQFRQDAGCTVGNTFALDLLAIVRETQPKSQATLFDLI